jgi:hypothetical protein
MSNSRLQRLTNLPFFLSIFLLVFTLPFIYSCGLSNDLQNDDNQNSDPQSFFSSSAKYAIVATQASDFSSGAHSAISYGAPRTAINKLLPTVSDLALSSYGSSFYRIERFGANNITKFNMESPHEPVWQFSTEGSESDSNPYQMVFVNETKAYLLRYGSPKLWIVNPSATQEAEFKTGEIDLSAYSNCDGLPEMASAIIVGTKLFVVLQRLCSWMPTDDAYIAVFNTVTDTEIETGQGLGGLKGIKLDVTNPVAKIKHYDGYLYVAGADGWLFGPNTPLKAGLQRVSLSDYTASAVLESDIQVNALEVLSHNKVYISQYNAWGDTSLRLLDFETGSFAVANVAGIGDSGNRSIQSMIKDADGMLWISDAWFSNPGVYILDTSDDSIQEGPISTNLNPIEVVFCER